MQYRSVIKSAAVVGSFVLLSRVFGLVRDIFFAHCFGTSLAKSAFDVAFRIPNLFRRLFGEGALSASFIPIFTESLEKEGREKAWALANRVISLMTVVLAVLVIGGMAAVTVALAFCSGAKAALTLQLLRIMLPFAFFICLVALSMAILNSFRHFVLPAATPVVLNLVLIALMAGVCPRLGTDLRASITVVAWGVVAAGVIQLAIQYPMLRRYGYGGGFSLDWRDERVRKVLVLMIPASLGMGVTQVNVLVNGVLALWVGEWAPAALTYAEHMIYLPLGLFATSLGTVLLPLFSRHSANAEYGEITRTVNHALRHLMFLMIPSAVGMIVLAEPIIRVILERGSFNAESTMLTARALQFYAPGLFAFSLSKVFAPAFYAMKDTVTPVKVSASAIGLNFVLNVVCVAFLPLYYKHAGIAIGAVIAETVNGVVLGWLLTRRIGSPGWGEVFRTGAKVLAASAVLGGVTWWAHGALLMALAGWGWWGQTAALGGSIAGGMAVYLAMSWAMFREELSFLRRRRG